MKSERMQYRLMRGAGIEVSAVSLGTLGYLRGNMSAAAFGRLVGHALDGGVNLIDTAYAYADGDVEKAIGPVLEKRRDEVHVLTRSHFRTADEFKKTFEGSFERLRTDYIDIFEFHDVGSREDYEKIFSNGLYDMAREAEEKGRVGCVGISTHAKRELMETICASDKFRVITLGYNLTGTKRTHHDGEDAGDTAGVIMPLAGEHGMGITVMKPFAGGTLLQPAPDGTRLTVAECLRYILANPLVGSVSPGVDSIEQLDEALEAGRPGRALTKRQLKQLEKKGSRWGLHFCRRCGYCLPCKEKIEIPAVMKLLEYHRGAADEERKKQVAKQYEGLKVKASACVECRKCEEKCPYKLPVSERMKEAAEAFE